MCARARKLSEADLYHVTFRGVAKRIIFEEEEDYRYLGRLMRTGLKAYDVDLYAWCFMSNHAHLLLRAPMESISRFMKELLSAYARYFNSKYERVGHLFQGRFGSVPILTEEQLKVVVRYIHRNPLERPGTTLESYKWSSYQEYLRNSFVSKTELVMSLFNGVDEFVRFHEDWGGNSKDTNKLRKLNLDDSEALVMACDLFGTKTLTWIATLEKIERDDKLAVLKEAGFPISQIVRLTEINRNTVQRAQHKVE